MQGVKTSGLVPLESEHSYVELGSLAEKPNVGFALFVMAAGLESMVTVGGVVSASIAVVKAQILSVASALPVLSLTPVVIVPCALQEFVRAR